jgi:hypothetical protein
MTTYSRVHARIFGRGAIAFMGVRMYTAYMQMTTPLLRQSSVVVDWTGSVPDSAMPEEQVLLDWVKQFPFKSNIHIMLPSSRLSGANRRLQATLQLLGCRVTRKEMVPVS